MIYFIPAWYKGNEFCEKEQNWYTKRMETEFDDSVKQIQLFNRNRSYQYKILLLSFAPNFRHFLHRQGVYHAPYWCAFDTICEVTRESMRMFSYHDLTWPEEIEFLHTPYVIVAQLHGKKYAEIQFGEDGNAIEIDLYKNGEIVRKNLYDDRGFIGSTILYQDGNVHHQDYLMTDGTWKIRYFYSDGHVEVNKETPQYSFEIKKNRVTKEFAKRNYRSMEELVQEVLANYVSYLDEDDIFVYALGCHHDEMVAETLRERKTIASLFAGRTHQITKNTATIIENAGYIISDAKETTDKLIAETGKKYSNLMEISPFDTRVDLGISQQLAVQNIFVPVYELEEEEFFSIAGVLGKYLAKNRNAEVHLFTRENHRGKQRKVRELVIEALERVGINPQDTAAVQEDGFETERERKRFIDRFVLDQCVTELEVSKVLKEQRVIVDMGKGQELYLQVSAVSMGIPEIVTRATEFLVEGENAYVISSVNQLEEALTYYLESLANWNKAVVASFEIGKKHTTNILLNKWKEVIETVAKH